MEGKLTGTITLHRKCLVTQTQDSTQLPTTEEVHKITEESVRLMRIIMPQVVTHMESVYKATPGQTHGRFVHYTTAEAALSIIRSRRFWLRNTNCMADYREVQHGFDIYDRYFRDTTRLTAFKEALDACAPGSAGVAFSTFNNWWQDVRFNTYIACVSEHPESEDLHGRLSMWRAFGGSATRVGLVFRVPFASLSGLQLALTFNPVSYLPEPKVHESLDLIATNLRQNHEYLSSLGKDAVAKLIFNMLLSGIVCLKHEGFHEEREWRAIFSPKLWTSPLMSSSIEVVAGVPQVVYKLPLDGTVSPLIADLDFKQVFDRLIVGPTPYPWPIYTAFVEALQNAGVPDSENRVFVSNIPIRS